MHTLVLMGGVPHDRVSWAKAIDYLMDGKAVLVESHDATVYKVSKTVFAPERYGSLSKWFVEGQDEEGREVLYLKAPAIVMLLKYVGFRRSRVAFSRRLVKERDNWECQFEGCRTTAALLKRHGSARLPAHLATVDHVYPRHLGGVLKWENAVTACVDCNTNRKGGKTLEESGLRLRSKPREPNWMAFKKGLPQQEKV